MSDDFIVAVVLQELPPLPNMASFPLIIADIARDCLQLDPASRPTATDIAERLVRWKFRAVDLNRDENGNTLLHRAVESCDEKKGRRTSPVRHPGDDQRSQSR